MNNNKKNKKMRVVLLSTMSITVALSCFSLTTFAQKIIDTKKDTTTTESQPPKDFSIQQEATIQQDENSKPSAQVAPAINLTEAQAQPFINAAKAYADTTVTSLPESGYKCINQYYKEEGKVTLTWLPDSWSDDLTPLSSNSGTVYRINFTDADLTSGTGIVQGICAYQIQPGNDNIEYNVTSEIINDELHVTIGNP